LLSCLFDRSLFSLLIAARVFLYSISLVNGLSLLIFFIIYTYFLVDWIVSFWSNLFLIHDTIFNTSHWYLYLFIVLRLQFFLKFGIAFFTLLHCFTKWFRKM